MRSIPNEKSLFREFLAWILEGNDGLDAKGEGEESTDYHGLTRIGERVSDRIDKIDRVSGADATSLSNPVNPVNPVEKHADGEGIGLAAKNAKSAKGRGEGLAAFASSAFFAAENNLNRKELNE